MKIDWLAMENEKKFDEYPDIFHAVVMNDVSEFLECLAHEDTWASSSLNQTRSAFDNMTPVHLACVHGSREVFEAMLQYGKSFDSFILDDHGRRPLDYALAFRRDDMARMLHAKMYPQGWDSRNVRPPGPHT